MQHHNHNEFSLALRAYRMQIKSWYMYLVSGAFYFTCMITSNNYLALAGMRFIICAATRAVPTAPYNTLVSDGTLDVRR